MFSSTQYVLLALATAFYLLASFSLIKNKRLGVYFGLFFAAICMFSFAALLDDFINIWDERFHFLVAKNMIEEPFKPMLYADPVLDVSYDFWAKAHIWLHKQPLFMWQMALSMKVFGTNIFAARFPSVVLSSIGVVTLYRSGVLLADKYTGFLAATLMLTSFYWMELISGRQQLDQNDVSFVSYVSLSVWAYLEYYFSNNKRWLILIGLFSGFAILCKWLAGLFVYSIWGLYTILDIKSFKRSFLDLLTALAVTIFVSVPWQIYTAIEFPVESAQEQAYNFNHLFEPIEGHGGEWNYYLVQMENYFGVTTIFILILAAIISLLVVKEKKLLAALIGAFCLQLVFFSWAATKMPSFALIGWIIGILIMAISLQKVALNINFIPRLNISSSILCIGTCLIIIPMRFQPTSFYYVHDANGDGSSVEYIRAMLHNKEVFKKIDLEPDFVLFNVNGFHVVEAMFYTGLPVYGGIPTQEQVIELKGKNRRIAILSKSGDLPDYIHSDQTILLIAEETKVLE